MADVNVKQHDSFTATHMLKSNAGDRKYARKRIYQGCSVRPEKSVPRDHCLAKPRDAKLTLGRIYLSALHTHEKFLYSMLGAPRIYAMSMGFSGPK